jgi:serine protease Do
LVVQKICELGQTVIAIGNALGEFRNTVSVGVVSGLSRSIVAGDETGASELLDEVIQTDAAINPGNSGGPLVDLNGNVIGVNVAVAEGSQNIGFALPADTVKTSVDSVKTTGKISRPYLGVRYIAVNETIKEKYNLSVDYGVLVTSGTPGEPAVLPNSPAKKAGIQTDDIILEFDGTKLTEDHSLTSLIRGKKVGDKAILKILRDNQQKTVQVTLSEYPM